MWKIQIGLFKEEERKKFGDYLIFSLSYGSVKWRAFVKWLKKKVFPLSKWRDESSKKLSSKTDHEDILGQLQIRWKSFLIVSFARKAKVKNYSRLAPFVWQENSTKFFSHFASKNLINFVDWYF